MHRLGAGAEAIVQAKKLQNKLHIKVLRSLYERYLHNDEFFLVSFDILAKDLTMPRSQVRRIVRALARKGFVILHRGVFSEDGDLLGSAYGITGFGRVVYELLDDKQKGIQDVS